MPDRGARRRTGEDQQGASRVRVETGAAAGGGRGSLFQRSLDRPAPVARRGPGGLTRAVLTGTLGGDSIIDVIPDIETSAATVAYWAFATGPANETSFMEATTNLADELAGSSTIPFHCTGTAYWISGVTQVVETEDGSPIGDLAVTFRPTTAPGGVIIGGYTLKVEVGW